PLGRREDRAPGALQPPYRGVVVEADHEHVTQGPRRCEIADVPGMEEVEAAVREDDPRPGGARRGEAREQRRDIGGELPLHHGGATIAEGRSRRKAAGGLTLGRPRVTPAARWRASGAVAGGIDGLAPGELGTLVPTLTEARALLAARRAGAGPLVPRREVLAPVLDDAAAARTEFDTLVVLGTGTLARALEAVAAALPGAPGTGLRLVAANSIDPLSVHELLARVDPRRTLFDVVSRSGETAETLAQFLIVRDRLLRDLGALDYKRHLLVTTDAQRGPLRQIVNDEGFRSLPAAPDLPAGRALL